MAEGPQVLIFPLPATGHITPLFQLAQLLASQHVSCTFLTPARHHPALLRSLPAPLQPLLRLLPALDGLPTDPSFELSAGPEFFRSVDLIQTHLESLLSSTTTGPRFTCLISDGIIPWTSDVAEAHDVPRVEFWPMSVRMVSMVHHTDVIVAAGHISDRRATSGDHEDEDDEIITCVPGLPTVYRSDLSASDPSDFIHHMNLRIAQMVKPPRMVLVNSVYELEKAATDALCRKVPVHTVGPLLCQQQHRGKYGSPAADGRERAGDACLQWLDTQTPRSVLFVAFGSTGSWSPEELKVLAEGLAASEQPFLWALRPTLLQSEGDLSLEDILGLTAETRGCCMVVPWAPQVEVLQHPAVGGFLTHCGWNSVMESLYNGVPMIGWPKVCDQTVNTRVMAGEWGVGMRLPQADGSVTSGQVENAVRKLLGGVEGTEARQKARRVADVLRAAAAGDAVAAPENMKTAVNSLISELKAWAVRRGSK